MWPFKGVRQMSVLCEVRERSTIASHLQSASTRFKKWHGQGLVLKLKMDVDTLGGWTQNIRLPTRSNAERSVQDEQD